MGRFFKESYGHVRSKVYVGRDFQAGRYLFFLTRSNSIREVLITYSRTDNPSTGSG
jgi:hypothetical protein